MPYDLKTRSGIVLRNIPDDVDPNAPELKALVQRQLAARAKPQPTLQDVQAVDPAEVARMSTEGMSGPEKLLVNTGAGFNSLLQGLRQVGGKFGLGDGVSDEEIQEVRDRDKGLADNTTGGWVAQVAGEAVPTMLIPFGTGAKGVQLAAKGTGALSKTLGRQAAQKAAQAVESAVGKGTTRAVVDSAATGAATGALGPVKSDESRLGRAAVGATIGAAIPAVGRAVAEGYRSLTKKGAGQAAARVAQEAAGDDPALLRRLDAYNSGSPDIPLTSAAVAQNEGLAALEQGARARRGADFYEGDQQRAQAVFDKVLGSTEEAGELASRRASRKAEWESNWGTAEQLADPQVFQQRMAQFVPALEQALRSPEATNPAVRGVVQDIASEIARLGEDFTPAHLQQIRANLNARGKALPQNAYQAAPRDSPAVNSLIQEIDNVLDETTQGAWGAVRNGYELSSRGVDASKAAGRVREAFVDPTTGRVRGTAADVRGDVPAITEAGLGRALDAARAPDKSSVLSEGANRGLNETLDALRRQSIVQRVKRSATAGGGSDTISNAITSGLADKVAESGTAGAALNYLKGVATRKREAALVDALRNPEEMARLLRMQASNPGDLTTKEKALLAILRSGGPTLANEAAEPQQ